MQRLKTNIRCTRLSFHTYNKFSVIDHISQCINREFSYMFNCQVEIKISNYIDFNF